MRVEAAQIHAFGSSYVKLSGSGTDLSLEACGANIVDLGEYETVDAQLEVSCASKVILGAAGQLVGDATQHARSSMPASLISTNSRFTNLHPCNQGNMKNRWLVQGSRGPASI
jgi:hypothetical protein